MDHVNDIDAIPQGESSTPMVIICDTRPRKKVKRTSLHCHASIPKIRFWITLAKHNLPLQLDCISKESLQYFQPYRENHFPPHLQKILRTGNFTKLRHECTISELRLHNQFGETLIHVLCKSRWFPGIAEIVEWLLDDVHLPLNVRDIHGRSPLHVACMVPSAGFLMDGRVQESFALVRTLVARAPELLLFEDNHGQTPLDFVSFPDYGEWNEALETDTPAYLSRIRRFLTNITTLQSCE